MNLEKIKKDIDSSNDVFDSGTNFIKNNKNGVMNKKIRDKLLNMVLDKKAVNPKSDISSLGSERNTETNDLIRKIFDTDNKIFTDSINHEMLCNNLKYELFKIVEADKPFL